MYRKAHTLLIVAAAVTALQVLAPYVQCQRSVRRPLIRAPRGAPTTDRYIVVLKGEEDLQQVVAQVLDVSEAGQVYEKIENVLIVKLSAEALETVRFMHERMHCFNFCCVLICMARSMLLNSPLN